jgi:hypothetical protein
MDQNNVNEKKDDHGENINRKYCGTYSGLVKSAIWFFKIKSPCETIIYVYNAT